MKKFKKSEFILLTMVLGLIGVSEYYFVFLDQPLKAIFIGLWCPTILLFVLIFNLKNKNGKYNINNGTYTHCDILVLLHNLPHWEVYEAHKD